MKKVLFVIALLGGAAAAYGYYGLRTVEFVPEVSTTRVTTGDVVDTVGATGALEALTTVQVGSQVSGIIEELYVDFNSIVREGDVIMRLDPSLFETQLEQARANLLRAEADVERLRVGVDDAATQLARSRELAAGDLISEIELEAADVSLRSAEAQLKSAEAQVAQAQASLNQNEVNLEHTVIRTPIDGIVTSRLVDVGQTVAASFQAPELFVIAADLTKMRVIADIDESDVGRIRPSQRVTFTVDAYPAEEFEGSVSQIRLEPLVTQNVVTYATVIDAPNPDLKLKPGMTATVTIEVARRNDVLRVPAAAIRFRPTPAMFAALNQPVPADVQGGAGARARAGRPDRPRAPDVPAADAGPARGLGAPPGRGRPAASAVRVAADRERSAVRVDRQARSSASGCANGCNRCPRRSVSSSSPGCGNRASGRAVPADRTRAGPVAVRAQRGDARPPPRSTPSRRSNGAPPQSMHCSRPSRCRSPRDGSGSWTTEHSGARGCGSA